MARTKAAALRFASTPEVTEGLEIVKVSAKLNGKDKPASVFDVLVNKPNNAGVIAYQKLLQSDIAPTEEKFSKGRDSFVARCLRYGIVKGVQKHMTPDTVADSLVIVPTPPRVRLTDPAQAAGDKLAEMLRSGASPEELASFYKSLVPGA